MEEVVKHGAGLVLVSVLAFGTAVGGGHQEHSSTPQWVVAAPSSHAMGLWKPRHQVLNGVPSCTPAFHDSFFVVAQDGHRYPTWHPPIAADPATGTECAFGHEHGRDPRGSQLWKTRQVQRAFYFDADGNGAMSAEEEAWAGLPFGYVNAQADTWFAANGIATMRHEDHTGHKVEWANDETDVKTHSMSTVKNSGVWIGRLDNGIVAKDTGMRCYFLGKVHQGTSSPDAFRHNLHEVMFFQDCRHRDDLAKCADAGDLSTCPDRHSKNARVSLSTLHAFGRAGGFTSFAPLCGAERRSKPADFVTVGHSAYSREYPDGAGDREIITRECVEKGFLVDAPTFSGNAYEAWPATVAVRTKTGKAILDRGSLLFDVNDAVRYYYPETLKAARQYDKLHPELAGTDLGYMQDTCYEKLGTRQARYGLCDAASGPGQTAVAWDDPRAGFRGLNRGMYFQPPALYNAGGAGVWYTDPFGGNATTGAFPGALRQEISSRNVDYRAMVGGLDPRVVMRVHADGRGTVHAPN